MSTKIDVFKNSINLFDTIGRPILWRQQTNGLLFNGGYSTFVYHRWRICISSLKAPDKGLSEKRITVITQVQDFKFYNAFAHKWISPWRMFPSNSECVFQSSFAFYDISNDLCDITVKTVIFDDLVMEFEVKVRTCGYIIFWADVTLFGELYLLCQQSTIAIKEVLFKTIATGIATAISSNRERNLI